MNRLVAILFWSVIAAAFVGPGTVTTCARAGVEHRYALLWAVVFSTITCLVLQEASARLTIVSGRSLGEALRERYRSGAAGVLVLLVVLGAIVAGCAAYQAGNVLGAVAGTEIAVSAPRVLLIGGASLAAALLLWLAAARTVARAMGLVVAVMGLCFVVTAVLLAPAPGALARGALVPRIPDGAGLLVLGVVGTTVVPYNLFLGSGLARGQTLTEMRIGLGVAVGLGGLISAAVLVVGGAVDGTFSFEALAGTLAERLGAWARLMFAIGLFCAGISSAITAPLAAAVTARSLFARRAGAAAWGEGSWRYRAVWLGVLVTGAAFALAAVRPVHMIVMAQALNGVLLPFVAVFLMLVVNDRKLMGDGNANRWPANLLMGVVVAITLVLGLSNVARALGSWLG